MPETVSEGDVGTYLATFDFARNLVAACPTFVLDVLGVADAAEAKDKIYYQETLAEEDEQVEPDEEGGPPVEMEPRPYCIIFDGQRTTSRAGIGEWAGEGQLALIFEVLVPDEYIVDRQADDSAIIRKKFRDRKRWAMRLVGRLEQELLENSGKADEEGNEFLNVVEIELLAPPADPDEAESDDYVGFAFQVRWK
jgi:hypothetical protein